MGESLYGQDDYGEGNYSQSPYFNLAGIAHIELTSAPAAMRATLSLVGGATHIELGNSSATAALIRMLEGSAGIVLHSFEADWEAEYSFSASASIELGFGEVSGTVILGLEPSGPIHTLLTVSGEVEMYGGPYWADDAPPEQTWTPISVGGFGG